MSYNKPPKEKETTWGRDILLLSIMLSFLFFFLLGTRPLFVPDEGRYAEIAREMFVRADFITPFLNNIKYFEKPILFYWLGALAFKIGGVNIWAIRSVNAIISLLGCLVTYFFTRKLYDRLTAFLAAIILSTSSLFFIMTHMVSLDLPVTIFISFCLYAFLLGLHSQSIIRRNYFWLGAGCAALAVLTKGLIGILFPIIIIFIWLIITKEWRLLQKNYLLSSLCIFILIILPWHFLIQYHNPEFFYFYFIEQHFLRYVNPDIGHYQPMWFFIPCLILGFFPWSVFLPQTIFRVFKSTTILAQKKKEVFLLIWALFVLAFFSFSKSKLIPYILPMFPPLAILTAIYLREKLFINRQKNRGVLWSNFFLLILSIVIFIMFEQFTRTESLPQQSSVRLLLCAAASILILGSFFSYLYSFKNIKRSIQLNIITCYFFLVLVISAAPGLDNRSILPIAKQLNKIAQANEEVITFNRYYQDLPFYLAHHVSILNWRNELSYGMRFQDAQNWMIDDATFWQRFHQSKRLFVVIDFDEFEKIKQEFPREKFKLLYSGLHTLLISNH